MSLVSSGEVRVVIIDMEEDTGDTLCDVCQFSKPAEDFFQFSSCGHSFCLPCVETAFNDAIMGSRVNLQCLKCPEDVLQSEIKQVVDSKTFDKYLAFTVRQYLSQQPDTCFCLAPNCPYACINASFDSGSSPPGDQERHHFVCRQDECLSEHCNKCKRAWHPNKTCEEFQSEPVEGISESLRRSLDAKNCPTCAAVIQKSSDGCNQVVCAMCKTSFCWLCGKRVTEMHFMSPTGCSLYGTRRWSKKRRYCCRVFLWLTAPLLALLLSIVVVPVVLIALPLGVGYKVHKICTDCKCYKAYEVVCVAVVVAICVLLSPLVALLAALLVFPLTLLYAYCFIPLHVCMQSSS